MRTKQLVRSVVALLLVSLSLATSLSAQTGKKDKKAEKAAAIKALVDAQNYVFKAQSATPTGGRFLQLTTSYTVVVSKDTVKSDLPYFGRAYSAPIDPFKGGIQFTSTNFNYKNEEIKNGWRITIKPADAGDVQQFQLSIFNNGSASLQVISTNRQPISFNGSISDRQK
jgi:type II secretory pathway pseudopilin PulG